MNKIENPFSSSELQQMFEKQRDKQEFIVKKMAKDESGHQWVLTINGRKISAVNFDIWHDDYIISYDRCDKTSGGGYAINRVNTLEEFKAEIFKVFHLQEPAQMTLF